MRVWMVGDHEPLPIDPGDRKPMRTGMLCAALAAAGHETTWFTSSTDHYLKRMRPVAEAGLALAPNLTVRILAVPSYRKNISLRRLLHNAMFARAFQRVSAGLTPPDVVVAALPTPDAAAAAIAFAKKRRIPSVVDVMDIWPDSFRTVVSPGLLGIGAPAIALLDRQVRFACARATSVVAVSEAYLHWAARKGRRDDAGALDRAFPIGHIPRPHPGPEAQAAFLRRIGIESESRIVSFIGSWGWSHDLELVLGAARMLADRQDIRFVLAGDAATQPELHARFAELPNVVLPGWLGALDMAMLGHASDIGLLPYRRGASQSLPNKVFEYMSHGVYQIATLGGEISELYARTGTGRSVAPTVVALVDAIREQLAQPRRADERARRIAAFEQNFAGGAVYRLMVDHIVRVAGRETADAT